MAVVGALDRLVLAVEAVERDDRAEGLLAEALHVGRDALEDGGLEDERAEVGPRLAAGEHARALGDGVLDVGGHGVELGLRDERAHVDAPVEAGAERHRLGAGDEGVDEAVVDLVGDEEALHRDAELPGVGEHGPYGALRRAVHVGVAQDEHRVLAAQLQRAADQPVGALAGDQPAGGGGAGEADVVGGADQRAADLGAGPGHDLPQVGGDPRLLEQLRGQQGGEHGLRVGLGHDGVAGQQRGDAVAQRHRQGVVPRRDDADDALGHPADLGTGQHREHAADALGVEVLVRGAGVVARGEGEVGDLEVGVLAGLARLPDHEVDELDLAVEQQVVEAQQRGGAVVDRRRGPGHLRLAGAGEGRGHVGRARLRDVRQRRAADRGEHGVRLAGRARDPAGQAGDVRPVERVGRGAVVLGVVRTLDDRAGGGALLTHPGSLGRGQDLCYRCVTSSQHLTFRP